MEQSSHAYFYFLILFLTLMTIVGAVAFLSFRTGGKNGRSVDADGSRVLGELSAQNVDGGGFSGAVDSQKGEQLA